ncbi:MAG: DUF885 family protein [Alphaproteobacteria bacterium]|nr:DUF885 family protein [Alphaproteobacteria bacterium]MBU1515797.1 DUF885 family protein [Alphaproteobacteria bacterium]MBU2094019.1 DUF885 family protein [Alphaproteobacteria bacterium]MBU2152618.1 DUF885 family protein [Alphaproteobacteria bacterium]MBU2308835.1 DUF885 family protein [Alphaproteobacteria bacterium]
MDRRTFLGTAAAVALAPAARAATPEDTKLRAIFDRFFEDNLADSPESVTRLGLDKGPRAAAKSKLDSASLKTLAESKARTVRRLAELKTVDRAKLSPADQPNYDAVLFTLEGDAAAGKRYAYGMEGAGQPYVLSQLTGAYQDIPDFLGSQHSIETKADCDAYLARLSAFGTVMDEEVARVRHDVVLGVVPPTFILERALHQMQGLRAAAPAASPLTTQLTDRAKAKGVAGDWAGQAERIIGADVYPALDRQIALLQSLQPKANRDAGVWKLPDGEAYYRDALRNFTTTTLTPKEVHQLGLDTAKELNARAEVILAKQGMTQGTVGERIAALFKDPKYLYADTDAAKEKLISDLNGMVAEIRPRLPTMFGTVPKANVEIRRVPKFIEAGAPGGYYNRPALDGSRPGIYWINLRDSAENPSWTLKTLTYHEAIPGHHLQRSLQQEAALPMLRKMAGFPAFAEGWALYAEQVALEMGEYKDDPLGELGQIQASLFRAARLVVDTGLHSLRWSREKAIETMTSIDGSPTSSATTEIERYCIRPGQACAYMVGKLTWLRLRAKAQAALGPRFDIRKFHDAVLLGGAMPLTVVEGVVDRWIATNKA